jgi:hypothetical protein
MAVLESRSLLGYSRVSYIFTACYFLFLSSQGALMVARGGRKKRTNQCLQPMLDIGGRQYSSGLKARGHSEEVDFKCAIYRRNTRRESTWDGPT